MTKGKIVIISGPSGSGKTTLHKKLLSSKKFKGRLVKSVSVTTRPIRQGEKGGRDYVFVPERKFLHQIKTNHFLEWQKVFDHYYGTPQKTVHELLEAGKNVLLCIDVKGANVVSQKYPEAIRIFIKGPSLAALKKRLKDRGSEGALALKVRLQTARRELREAKNYDYILVNDNLAKALRELGQILFARLP